ncbi:hypothetical protein PTTG_29407 [Puccinia triticina 1-1 BBBD Race 1]|uniref:Uncharacterized protein n=1 Tax=Puccinia triticina (isolate 1-1 / race 1 (BBBD)) TaxID=630390 RepID=A0A180G4L1_PUCT1|nr:hypothetical protein PTTG_29407 [Puccinia triticina 1-1 BBBD Race 1]
MANDHPPGEGVIRDVFQYAKLLLDGNEEEFVKNLGLHKYDHQSSIPQPVESRSPVQLDENHEPTASTQFPHESNSEDAGPFGNHIFSDRFSSPSILPTYSSIPSTLAPGDPDALVKPAFQTETPSPTFNEHPTIAPSAPTPHTPKKATMEKTLKPTGRNFKRPAMKLKAAKISEASEELKATNKSEENLEKILGLEGIQVYRYSDRFFTNCLVKSFPTLYQTKIVDVQKYDFLPLWLECHYSFQGKCLIGVNHVLTREGQLQSKETLRWCFSQLSSSSLNILKYLAQPYPTLLRSTAHGFFMHIYGATYGTPKQVPLIGMFYNPQDMDLNSPSFDETQRLLLHFFSSPQSFDLLQLAAILIGKYLMKTCPLDWRNSFSSFDVYMHFIKNLLA